MQLSEEKVRAFRARRTHLTQRARAAEMETVAGALGGVQAQVHSAAQLALCGRTEDLRPANIEEALWERETLLRTWTLRGTLHLVRTRDAPVILRALDGGMLSRGKRWLRRRGIAEEEIDRMLRDIGDALREGPLTRAELTETLVQRRGENLRSLVDDSWGGITKIACMSGLARCGPPRGREVTFTRPGFRLPPHDELPTEEALARLFRRYLRAYGPAGVGDFAHWTGVTVREARAALARMEEEVVQVCVRDRPHLLLADDLPVIEEIEPLAGVVRLLPAFDVSHLAHRDKSILIDGESYSRVFGAGGWIRPSVFADGRIVGTWSHSRRTHAVDIEVQAFGPLCGAVRERIDAEAGRLGPFFDRKISLTFSP